jgi:SAM-dependent methyltransferase
MLDPERMRSLLAAGRASPHAFRTALANSPADRREGWLDRVFGLGDLPEDGPELPRGCVPYLPSSLEILLRVIELADVRSDDVFVDIGSGLGRALALTHFATGAGAIGVEIQPALVRASRELAARLNAQQVSVIEGDAARVAAHITTGSAFFLYCPFGGDRLNQVLNDLESIARTRVIRVCSLDLPLPSRPWLTPVSLSRELAVYRSRR